MSQLVFVTRLVATHCCLGDLGLTLGPLCPLQNPPSLRLHCNRDGDPHSFLIPEARAGTENGPSVPATLSLLSRGRGAEWVSFGLKKGS